jgi:hypothetical protein
MPRACDACRRKNQTGNAAVFFGEPHQTPTEEVHRHVPAKK